MADADPRTVAISSQKATDQVSYGEPVVLHESMRRRIVFIPFFIRRSEGTDLSIKIQAYRKGRVPNDWLLIEERSLSLNEPASRKLLAALRSHLALADQDHEDGRYIVVPVRDGIADLSGHNPVAVAKAVAGVLGQPEVVGHLADVDLGDELLAALRGAMRAGEIRSAVTQLRSLLENGEASEQAYQRWCEANSWAFGSAYVVGDDVREITPGDQLDVLLPKLITGYRDIVELKRPNVRVLLWDDDHSNFYFSSDVSRALGQCHRYLDVFHEVAAHGLRDHPEVVAYHPRAILVIGRSDDWTLEQHRALHGLNARLNGIVVMTYDQLLAQGERLLQVFAHAESESRQAADVDPIDAGEWDDDEWSGDET